MSVLTLATNYPAGHSKPASSLSNGGSGEHHHFSLDILPALKGGAFPSNFRKGYFWMLISATVPTNGW